MFPPSQKGHSAEVRMWMVVEERTIPLAQMAPDFVILQEPQQIPPCRVDMFLSVDGHLENWPAHLPKGVQPHLERTPIARI